MQQLDALDKKSINAFVDNGVVVLNLHEINASDISSFTFKNAGIRDLILNKTRLGIVYNMFDNKDIKDEYLINISGGISEKQLEDRENLNRNLAIFSGLSDTENTNNFIYPFFSKRRNEQLSGQAGLQETYSVNSGFRDLPGKVQKLQNESDANHAEYHNYCKKILGFVPGILPDENGNGFVKVGMYLNGRSVPIELMGDGVVNILGLITLLLTSNGKLFLIEEPENDLHPKALKELLNLMTLKSDSNQFIISTHSNIVLRYLGGIQDSKIFHVNGKMKGPNGEYRPSVEINEITENEDKLNLLVDLGYELIDSDIFNGYILFEESSAEQIVKEFLIPAFVPELLGKVCTIAAQGVNDLEPRVNDLHRLFLYTHLNPMYENKVWVFADGDKAGIDIIDEMKRKFTTWPSTHFCNFKEPDFEKYYPKRYTSRVEELFKLKDVDKTKFRELKKELTKDVVSFIKEHKEIAKEEFKVSSNEIIVELKNIASKLKNN